MAMQAIRAAGKETVPGVPSRLPALAGEAFGTFVLTLSGTATLLATARIGHSTAATVGTQIAVSVAFGFGILAAVYTVATVSGAHINPVYAGSCGVGGVVDETCNSPGHGLDDPTGRNHGVRLVEQFHAGRGTC